MWFDPLPSLVKLHPDQSGKTGLALVFANVLAMKGD